MSEAEIGRLVDRLPSVKSATVESSRAATEQIKAKLRIQLRELKICPQKIDELGRKIRVDFYRSRIDPGEPVGITASEGIGGPATQMTLSGFHNAGSSKNVGSGVDIIRELLNMSQKRRVESTIIHFRDKNLSFEDVLHLRREIVGITVLDLLKTTPTIHANHRSTTLPDGTRGVEVIPYGERGWWYETYLAFMGMEARPGSWDANHYIRLEINKTRMFSFNLTPADIVRTIESEQSKMLRCIVTPSVASECIIDIYPDQYKVMSELETRMKASHDKGIPTISIQNASLLLLKFFVAPQFGNFIIKGIKGITQIFPQTVRTISVIRAYEKRYREVDLDELTPTGVSRETLSRQWSLWLDPIKLKTTGIPISKIRKLLDMCGIAILEAPLEEEDDYYSIEPKPRRPILTEPPRFVVQMSSDRNPRDIINERLKADDDQMNETVKQKKRKITALSVIRSWSHSSGDGSTHQMTLDPSKMVSFRVSLAELTGVFESAGLSEGITVIITPSDDPNVYTVGLSNGMNPKQWIGTHVPQSWRFAAPIVSELGQAGSYTYAETNGSNLRATLAHPLIDNRRSISNNANHIYAIISLQAAYSFIVKDFYDTIVNNSAYCSPRHITTLVSFMTNISLMPITSRGISRQNRGAFSDASFEHAIEAFLKSATSGAWEGVNATSTSIFLGNRGIFGTGAFRVALDEDALKAIRASIRTPRDLPVSVDAPVVRELVFANNQIVIDEGGVHNAFDVGLMQLQPKMSGAMTSAPVDTDERELTSLKSVADKVLPLDVLPVPDTSRLLPAFLELFS